LNKHELNLNNVYYKLYLKKEKKPKPLQRGALAKQLPSVSFGGVTLRNHAAEGTRL
jgi:hypothetical protein